MVFLDKHNILRITKRLAVDLLKKNGFNFGIYHMSTIPTERLIAKSKEELDKVKKMPFIMPENSKMLTVSVLGAPNAGKSTLTNMILGWRVCSVSKKVHTTKRNTKAVLTENDTQIVFLDTPGLVTLTEKRKHKLDLNMVVDPGLSLQQADLIIVLVDVTNIWTRHKLDPKVIDLLEKNNNKASILVLNKIDVIKSKETLLEITRLLTEGVVGGQTTHQIIKKSSPPPSLEDILKRSENFIGTNAVGEVNEIVNRTSTNEQKKDSVNKNSSNEKEKVKQRRGWPYFQDVFMISALTGDGVSDLKNWLLESAKNGKWLAKPYVVTDQTPHEIATLAVREKLLDLLPNEVPYVLKTTIEMWEVENGVLKIFMRIRCPEKRYVKRVIGPTGKTVSAIADAARQELMNTFRCEVSLKLAVEYNPRPTY